MIEARNAPCETSNGVGLHVSNPGGLPLSHLKQHRDDGGPRR